MHPHPVKQPHLTRKFPLSQSHNRRSSPFVTFRSTIIGGQLGSTDPEIGTIVWKTIEETERLVPYYRDVRGLYNRTAQYQVQSEYNRG